MKYVLRGFNHHIHYVEGVSFVCKELDNKSVPVKDVVVGNTYYYDVLEISDHNSKGGKRARKDRRKQRMTPCMKHAQETWDDLPF